MHSAQPDKSRYVPHAISALIPAFGPIRGQGVPCRRPEQLRMLASYLMRDRPPDHPIRRHTRGSRAHRNATKHRMSLVHLTPLYKAKV